MGCRARGARRCPYPRGLLYTADCSRKPLPPRSHSPRQDKKHPALRVPTSGPRPGPPLPRGQGLHKAGQAREAAQPPGLPASTLQSPAASHPPPLRISPPTSPGSSKIDIHPFLKFSRSGYGEMRKQMSQAQWRTHGAGGEGMLHHPDPEPGKSKGLGSQERGLRGQVTPHIQTGFPEMQPRPRSPTSGISDCQEGGPGDWGPPQRCSRSRPTCPFSHPRMGESGARRPLSVERPSEGSENRPDQRGEQTTQLPHRQGPGRPPGKRPLALPGSDQPCPSLVSWRP